MVRRIVLGLLLLALALPVVACENGGDDEGSGLVPALLDGAPAQGDEGEDGSEESEDEGEEDGD